MTAPARRVAVTGVGAISALGHDAPQMWAALCDGRSGIARIESVDVSDLRFQNGGEVKGLDPAEHFDPARMDLLDRFAQFALIAAREAVRDSGVELTPELRERTAVYTGSSLGGQTTQDAAFVELYQRKSGRVHPLSIPRTMANAGASQISMEFGLTGPCCTISTACSSANHAIGQAFWMVRGGVVDLAIAGGSEAPFSPGHLKAWEAMRVVAPDTCRPFSLDRRGLILGEGGAMLVLEPLEAARARGARIYAEISGFGMSSDAHHVTQPTVAGPARAMRAALADAELVPRADRLHQRSRHGNTRQRFGRGTRDPGGLRRSCGPPRRQLDQVDARTRPRRGRRPGGGRHRARPRERDPSADGELHCPGSRMRPRRRARPSSSRPARGGPLQLLRFRGSQRGARLSRDLRLRGPRGRTPRAGGGGFRVAAR